MEETSNVLYEGNLEPAGMTIYMEGTHKLMLSDGRFVMLQSTLDLNRYLHQHVQVLGAVRPTVEAGGIIMRVEQVASLEISSASSEESSDSFSSFSLLRSSSSGGQASSSSSISSISSISSHSSRSSGSSSSSRSPAPQSSAKSDVGSSAFEASTELSEKAAMMAKEKMSASLWTQEYCGKTVPFCIPIHKNWYFKSFGATASTLWHVEIGPSAINNLGEGPLTVNLVSGGDGAAGVTDGQVSAQGSAVVGYRSWTENRHFEIRGPASLKTAITFITSGLKAMSQ